MYKIHTIDAKGREQDSSLVVKEKPTLLVAIEMLLEELRTERVEVQLDFSNQLVDAIKDAKYEVERCKS